LSTLPRISLVLFLAACSPEQSKEIGNQPKKTIDKVTVDVDKAMKSERAKE
jgi:hypothetical protein